MHQFISTMNPLMAVFMIAALGYLIGSIRIGGIKGGTSGVLFVALIFGHFGCTLPSLVRNIGLVLFVASVGLISGPSFFRSFVRNAGNYVLLGAIIVLIGSLVCGTLIALTGIRAELASGLLAGALTSTPGLAAAQEAAGAQAPSAAIGYAIAYPFGVIGVVLFVQLLPKLLRVNIKAEIAVFQARNIVEKQPHTRQHFKLDASGFFVFTAVAVLGLLLGNITIPLGYGATFTLGTTGGPLLIGLVFGRFSYIGPLDLTVRKSMLETLREFGLMLFLIGAGVDGGSGFISTLKQEGVMLLLYGAAITLVPMFVGYIIATKYLKMNILDSLGAITGGMTSTPALGALISVAGTDDVAGAYAATYPVALVLVVLCSQLMVVLFR